jgi:threonine synthase
MQGVYCTQCGKPYPASGTPFQCTCGGIFDFREFPRYSVQDVHKNAPGLWRYFNLLGLQEPVNPVSLGEGNTALVPISESAEDVFVKLEYQNPTGSYKDRGTAVLLTFLKSRNVDYAVEDSSGNAGASFAAYAARAGVMARVYVPESASGPKRSQIEAYGAELVAVPGPRSNAAKAVLEEASRGTAYASHAFMPMGLTGIVTIAYEIVEQLGKIPGTIISPVGHGGLLYGIMRGFEAVIKSGFAQQEPFYLGVQSKACNPVARAFVTRERIVELPSGETIAEGVKVSNPVRGGAILSHIRRTQGKMSVIDEDQLLCAYHELADLGFFAEPTSALAYAALQQEINILPKPVVLILTGAGAKTRIS